MTAVTPLLWHAIYSRIRHLESPSFTKAGLSMRCSDYPVITLHFNNLYLVVDIVSTICSMIGSGRNAASARRFGDQLRACIKASMAEDFSCGEWILLVFDSRRYYPWIGEVYQQQR